MYNLDYTAIRSEMKTQSLGYWEFLIYTNPSLITDTVGPNYTLLHIAALLNKTDLAKLFIESGAIIDKESKTGTTPFLCACMMDSMEVAVLLIQNNASIIAQDLDKENCMHLAFRSSLRTTKAIFGAHYKSIREDCKYMLEQKNKYGEYPIECATNPESAYDQMKKYGYEICPIYYTTGKCNNGDQCNHLHLPSTIKAKGIHMFFQFIIFLLYIHLVLSNFNIVSDHQ